MAATTLNTFIQHLRRSRVPRDGESLTDAQLLENFIAHKDQAALTDLVKRHAPMVWGVCRRTLCNHHDAEDAFQATFLVLVRKAAVIRPREMAANWLYGVAHQTARKARATAARQKGRERQMGKMPEPVVSEQDSWQEVQPLLDDELSRLPDKYRAVIVLCDLEGKTRKETAILLSVPEGTVAGRLARARTMLAKRLTQRGLALSGGALVAMLSQNEAAAYVPSTVVANTIKSVTLFTAGTGGISVKVAALTEGVLKSMLISKLKAVSAVFLVAAFTLVGVGAGGLLLRTQAREPSAEQAADTPLSGAQKGGKDREQKPLKDGTLLVSLEKVDAREETITVTRPGALVGGVGGGRGGLAVFKNKVRLENLPVAKNARILVNGTDRIMKLTDLQPGMSVTLQVAVKGDITVQAIDVEIPGKAALVGDWIERRELAGDLTITFTADGKLKFDDGQPPVEEGSYKLNDKKYPPEIDYISPARANPANRLGPLLGIYRIENDTLTLFLSERKRPAKFEAPEGSGIMRLTLKRASKK